MDTSGVWGVTIDELERAIAAVEPAAKLVSPRIVRRVIKLDRQIPGPGLRVPHRKTYIISREPLLKFVDVTELALPPYAVLPPTVLLVAAPEPEKLAAMTRPRALVKYWRLLFHARIDAKYAELIASGRLTRAEVRRRIDVMGKIAFDEIRQVLRYDEFLLPPYDELSAYAEFAAVYLELRFFAPRLLPDYFPSLHDLAAIDRLLKLDFDGAALFAETRLPGAPMPDECVIEDEEASTDRKSDMHAFQPQKQSERAYCRLMERAERAHSRENVVRSAMLRARAAHFIGPKIAKTTREESRKEIELLATRLADALELDETVTGEWSEALAALLPQSIQGFWTPEARLLYDLQKVCVDHERGVYTLDLIGWAASFGRLPVKRELPSQREVLMSKHLRSAAHRLRAARLPAHVREQFSKLLEDAVERAEQKLRRTLRPTLEQALDEVGMCPTNLVETVARRKLVEELLDKVVDRGFLNIGDLRDAVARNNLKIRDLTGKRDTCLEGSWPQRGKTLAGAAVARFKDYWRGDQILQVDRRLGELLDGVYRPGEIYLRASQSLSSLGFGTRTGRFLTRYAALPFGGAFLILEAVRHVVHLIARWTSGVDPHELVEGVQPTAAVGHPIRTALEVFVLGLFLLGLMHSPKFREGCVSIVTTLWAWARKAFYELPVQLLQLPKVREFIESRAFQRIYRFAIKPFVFSAITILAISALIGRPTSWTTSAVVFAIMNLLINSRLGQNVDELVTDLTVRGWHQLRMRVFAALFHLIVEAFSTALESLERFLYSVDEWLRFRTGENRVATGIKVLLGSVWFFVTYVIRFCVTLLVEPQVNPIKHFPVVTVGHKIILPLAFVRDPLKEPSPLGGLLMRWFDMPVGKANGVAGSVVWLIPGIFGFLAWELKENWRVYAANRSPKLQPVIIGVRQHGETMAQLLRRGFHSGTVPKLFARLRRADRKAYVTGRWAASRKLREKLAHAVESVRHFIERDFIALIELSGAWPHAHFKVGKVELGAHHFRVEIERCDATDSRNGDLSSKESLWLTFQEQAGWLVADSTRPAWLVTCSAEQLSVLSAAMTGLLKISGVDLVREQIAAVLGPAGGNYDLVENGLVIWLDSEFHSSVTYDLQSNSHVVAPVADEPPPLELPIIDAHDLVFSNREISWNDWAQRWESLSRDSLASPETGDDVSGVESLSPEFSA